MKLSAQDEYGLRCLLAVARQGDGGFLTIPEISRIEGLSPSHVAKLLSVLRRAGLLRSTRGQLGGYSLSRPAAEITVREVLEALGGRLYGMEFCPRHSGIEEVCVHKGHCALGPLWAELQEAVDKVLERHTIADLAKNSHEMGRLNLESHANRRQPAVLS